MRRLLVVALIAVACTSAPASTSPNPPSTVLPTTPSGSPARTPTPEPWAQDLAALDRAVRSHHEDPFVIHSEAEWEARLGDVAPLLAGATPNEQVVLVASLIGLLDTHSEFFALPSGWHYYGLSPYRFDDGWFIVNAADTSLIGTRLVSIGGMAIEDVIDRLTPLVPHDNESGLLENILRQINSVEYLAGTGVVADVQHPSFVLEGPDGTVRTIDPPELDATDYDLAPVGWLWGEAPEAVARRDERIWTSLDEDNRTFLVSVNDYGDMSTASEAMTGALDDGLVDRVVVDMRYLRGGNADFPILTVMAEDERINRPGGLTVLIGRENVSAATIVAHAFDVDTQALLVGEPTPARADNFLCECLDITLPNSRYVITLPTHVAGNGDPRAEIAPDVPMVATSVDFFAGRDLVLDAALEGIEP